MSPNNSHPPTIILLKSQSTPEDKYAALFADRGYRPVFHPVLDHHFHAQNLSTVRSLVTSGQLLPGPTRRYGGLIFTSQRAVEAFGSVLASLDNGTPSGRSRYENDMKPAS
jgi:uroporphyrinogen-III synthase